MVVRKVMKSKPKKTMSKRKSVKRTGGALKKTVVMSRTKKPKVVKVEIAVKPSKAIRPNKPKKSSGSKSAKKVYGKGYVAGRMTKTTRTVRKPRARIVRK